MPSSDPDVPPGNLFRDLSEHVRQRRRPGLSRYAMGEVIGEGATAVVYRAQDLDLDRPVAIKMLRDGPATNDVARRRFEREARATAGLGHPNVVTVHDYGEAEGRRYLVMELVEGRSLQEILKAEGPGSRRVLELLEQAARGVAAAHARGIVHRDLKPANILVPISGEAKVGDFGLAHLADPGSNLTRSNVPLGTPLYMAPEQVEGHAGDIQPSTDVYALGAILYEAATGRTPHDGNSLAELYAKIVREDPERPRRIDRRIPRDLESIILKAMDKEGPRRFATAELFAADLRRYLRGEPVTAAPHSLRRDLVRRVRRRPAVFAAGAAAVVALIAGIALAAERDAVVARLQDLSRVSLQSALEFRRVGANERMRQFLPRLEDAYRETVRRAPASAEPEFLLGRMHRALMEDDRALEYQQRALRKDPDHAGALYERAVLLSKEYGRCFRAAVESARVWRSDRVTARDARDAPQASDTEAEAGREDLQRLRHRILDDCDRLERVLARRGTSLSEANLLAARGILSYHRARYTEARDLLRRAVERDPALEEAWETYVLAVSKEGGCGPDRLEALYTEGLARDRGYLPYLVRRGMVRTDRADDRWERGEDPHRDLDLAEEDFREALLRDPAWVLAWWARGIARTHRGAYRMARGDDPGSDLAAAAADFTEQLQRDPGNADALRRRGYARLLNGVYRAKRCESPEADFAAAGLDFDESIRRNPSHPQAWNWRGRWSLERGLCLERAGGDPVPFYVAAEADFTESLRRRRTYPDAWKRRGLLRVQHGVHVLASGGDPLPDFASAEEDLTEALRLSPGDGAAATARGRLRMLRGLHRERQGGGGRSDLEAAEADLDAVLRVNPAAAEAWALRGRLRIEVAARGEPRAIAAYASGVDELQRACRLCPLLEPDLREPLARARSALDRLRD